MHKEKRRHPRFAAIGRVKAEDICVFPGTLVNISSAGCLIRFPIHVSIDMEKEYELKIKLCHNSASKEMVLIGQPIYNNGETNSEVGMKLLRSPDSRHWESFVQTCKENETDFAVEEQYTGY